MGLIRAAGDEKDGWVARTAEDLEAADLWDAVEFAKRELNGPRLTGILENGCDGARLWYELGLSQSEDEAEYIIIGEEAADALLHAAERSAGAYDLLMEVCASRIEHGVDLPNCLRDHLCAHLRGRHPLTRPKGKTPDPEVWVRNCIINEVARDLGNSYDLARTRGKETESIAASDVIYHAMKDSPDGGLAFGTIHNILSGKRLRDYSEVASLRLFSILEDLAD